LEPILGLKEAIRKSLQELVDQDPAIPCGVIAIDAKGMVEWGSTSRAFLIAGVTKDRTILAEFVPADVKARFMPDKATIDAGSPTRTLFPSKSWLVPKSHSISALSDGWYSVISNIQDSLFHGTVDFFRHNMGYKYAMLPITTDTISSPMGLGSDSEPVSIKLFERDTYLADSMQFGLEYILRLNRAARGTYYLTPSFRGEDHDSTHLNQFFHAECELVGPIDKAMEVAERYISHMCRYILTTNSHEITAMAGSTDHVKRLLKLLVNNGNRFRSITMEEALRLDGFQRNYWDWAVPENEEHGRKITRKGEVFLINHFGGAVWLTEMDHLSVPFYQAFKDGDRSKGKCADLLLGMGETLGLGERHITAEDAKTALKHHKVPAEKYQWYLDIRNEGTVLQTSGWGIGLERFMCWLIGHDDVRDCQVVPRLKGQVFSP
jgi:beta-aspartyl-peptidase (threonine type)